MSIWHDIYYTAKDVAETVTFFCAPVLAYLAWRGLQQIRVTREVARMQAKRESFRIATERSEQYASAIVPLIDAFYKNKKDGKYKALYLAKVVEENGSIRIESDKMTDALKEVHGDGGVAIKLMNALEGFAMYFTCGIADEKVAYRPISYSFCMVVHDLSPILVVENKLEKTFGHTLRLYTMWRDRKTKEKCEAQMKELAKKASIEIKGIDTINI